MDAWMDDPRVISSVRVWKSRHEGASAHGRAGGRLGRRACVRARKPACLLACTRVSLFSISHSASPNGGFAGDSPVLSLGNCPILTLGHAWTHLVEIIYMGLYVKRPRRGHSPFNCMSI